MGIKLISIFIVLLLLCSCSLKLKINIFNDTEGPIRVSSDSSEILIESRQASEFIYPTDAGDWTLEIHHGKCNLRYRFPESLNEYSMLRNFEGKVLLRFSGKRIHLISPNESEFGKWEWNKEMLMGGFPLSPDTQKCK